MGRGGGEGNVTLVFHLRTNGVVHGSIFVSVFVSVSVYFLCPSHALSYCDVSVTPLTTPLIV